MKRKTSVNVHFFIYWS